MRRVRALVVGAALAASTLILGAPRAQASCQTNPDVGDFCKVIDAPCNGPLYKVWDRVTDRCQ
ncbi:MAG: hypothetical protein ACRDI3_05790 [Actinomycetota bacterium]